MWTVDKHAAKQYGINHVVGEHGQGLADKPPIRYGSNSGYQAVNLVYWFGATRILLIGYDMGCTGGKTHYFGDHPEGLQVRSPFGSFIQSFRTIDPKRYGIEIINCTPVSNLDCFPRMELTEALA